MEEKKEVYDFLAEQKKFAEKVLNFHLDNIITVLENKNVKDEFKENIKSKLKNILNLDANYLQRNEYKQTRKISYGVIEEPIDTSNPLFSEMLQESLSVIAGILYGDKRYFTEKDYTVVFNEGMDAESRFEGDDKVTGLWWNARNGMQIEEIENNLDDFIVAVQTIAKNKLDESFPELKESKNLRPNAQNCNCIIL